MVFPKNPVAVFFALVLSAPLFGGTPPKTWKEHWFEHDQLLKLVDSNLDVAIYFDDKVDPKAKEWITPFMTKLWRYTKKTYGSFGPDGRLYCIFHQDNYSGGHPSSYFDPSHDNRNVSDCAPGPWSKPNFGMASHEVSHIVEGANNGVHGSPAFKIWGDSKWAEIYQYDAYLALGLTAEAERAREEFNVNADKFPRPDTYWFRDWYYPIWRDHGGAKVLSGFFQLLTKYFPKERENNGRNKKYTRGLNWGEYVHFMSGAAAVDLQPLAEKAFGWPEEWEEQSKKAKKEFPSIRYAPAPRTN